MNATAARSHSEATSEPTRWKLVRNPFEAPISLAGLMEWATGGTLDSSVGQVGCGHALVHPTSLRGDRHRAKGVHVDRE